MIRISYVAFTALVAAASGLLFGYDTGIIADTQWQLSQHFSFSSFDWSMIVSAMVLGAFVGALCSAPLSEHLGRKKSLLLSAYIFIFATLFLAAGQGFYSILSSRFLLGVSIGIGSYSAPLFIAEIAPSHLRGRFVLFNSVGITAGEALSFLVGYCLENAFQGSWRLMFLIGMIPAMSLWFGLLFVPQSPRWLITKNQKNKAYSTLKRIRKGDVEKEWSELLDTSETHKKHDYRSLFKAPFRKLLLFGVGLGILQQSCGINIIMYYGPYLFHHAGFGKSGALLSTFMMGMVNFLFTLLALLYIDKIGRRRLMIQGTGLGSLALFILASTFFWDLHPYIAFASIFIFCMSFAMSIGCCFWLLISELYPLALRVQAMSISTSLQWLANFVISLVFLPLFEHIGAGWTLLIFSFCSFVSSIFSYYFVPETKNISLEKIEKNLMKGKRLRDLGLPLGERPQKISRGFLTQS